MERWGNHLLFKSKVNEFPFYPCSWTLCIEKGPLYSVSDMCCICHCSLLWDRTSVNCTILSQHKISRSQLVFWSFLGPRGSYPDCVSEWVCARALWQWQYDIWSSSIITEKRWLSRQDKMTKDWLDLMYRRESTLNNCFILVMKIEAMVTHGEGY